MPELIYDYLIVGTRVDAQLTSRNVATSGRSPAPGLKRRWRMRPEIRRRVLLAFELAERQMLETGEHPELNFVIVGGGPTGVELAGAISDIAKLYMRKDFRHINPAMAQVLILEGSPHILGAYPEDLQRKAVEQLNALGVKTRTNAHVSDIQPGYVMVGNERIESVCTLWAAGVQASPLAKMLGTSMGCEWIPAGLHDDRRSFEPAGAYPEVFIIGDMAPL